MLCCDDAYVHTKVSASERASERLRLNRALPPEAAGANAWRWHVPSLRPEKAPCVQAPCLANVYLKLMYFKLENGDAVALELTSWPISAAIPPPFPLPLNPVWNMQIIPRSAHPTALGAGAPDQLRRPFVIILLRVPDLNWARVSPTGDRALAHSPCPFPCGAN